MTHDTAERSVPPKLGLVDAICIILGIIIGAGIYETPRLIFGMMPNELYTYGIWAFCGLLALIGALCYAELATAYPRSGGDYVYHTRAYGPFMGYLFGWTQLAVIQTSSIGLMAYVFAEYGNRLWPIPGTGQYSTALYAAGAIVAMSLLNILGVVLGKTTQNILTFAKVLGLAAIVGVGFSYAPQHDIVIDGRLVSAEGGKLVLATTTGDKTFRLTEATRYYVDGKDVKSDATGKPLLDANNRPVPFTVADFVKDANVRVVIDLKAADVVRKLKTAPVVGEGPVERTEAGRLVVTTAAGAKTFSFGPATRWSDHGTVVAPSGKGIVIRETDAPPPGFAPGVYVRVSAVVADHADSVAIVDPPANWSLKGFLLSMAFPFVLVLLTYGGWNDAAFVAAEVKNPDRNIPLALVLGTIGVTAIYLLVNAGYLMGLGGFRGAQEAGEVAADVLSLLPWDFAEKAMCILVMISALGAVNGIIFTSSRIYSTMGSDYHLFQPLSARSAKTGSPIISLALQMVISLLMVLSVGTEQGQHLLNAGLEWLGQQPVSWAGKDGFSTLLQCTAPIFWIFFLLTAFAVFILRINEPQVPRPFRVPLYPVLPLIFCLYCGYMVYSGVQYAGSLGLVGTVLVFAGFPLYVFSRRSAAANVALPASSG
ncbi:MAG: amino acid permease [Gemmataceae bacterium]|nr:amino acid permease [Gemmataceae bacterium]